MFSNLTNGTHIAVPFDSLIRHSLSCKMLDQLIAYLFKGGLELGSALSFG